MAQETRISSGVQELIERLKMEGVHKGRDEAARMIEEAQTEAARLISQAREEAEKILAEARATIAGEREAAKASLKAAIRDTELLLESELKTGFSQHVKRLVSMELKDREFMRQLILAVAGRVCTVIPEPTRVELLMPKELFTADNKGAVLTDKGQEHMHHLVLGIAGDMLREGLTIGRGADGAVGLTIRLVGQDMEIDLSDNAIADLLLKFLLPRYRAIAAGVE